MDGKRTFSDRLRETTDKLKNFSVSDPDEKKWLGIVQRATSEMWINPDWSLNMELVDVVNSRQGRQTNEKVFRCLKRRLSTKNPKVQLLTLVLTETLVKNCGASFQSDLAQNDLWTDIATLADPRKKGDVQVVDKVLLMVEDYARTLRPQRFQKTFTDLKALGVRFPMRDPEEVGAGLQDPLPRSGSIVPGGAVDISEEDNAAIQAALRDLEEKEQAASRARQETYEPVQSAGLLSADTQDASQRQTQRLLSDLSVVQNSVSVLQETLASIPDERPEDVNQDFIKELAQQCGQMRPRVSQLIHGMAVDEEVLGQALTIYEVLDSTMNRYDALIAKVAQGPEMPPNSAELPVSTAIATGDVDLLGEIDVQERTSNAGARQGLAAVHNPSQGPAIDLLGDTNNNPAPMVDEFAALAAGTSGAQDGFDALAMAGSSPGWNSTNRTSAVPISTTANSQRRDGFDALTGSASRAASDAPGNVIPPAAPPPGNPNDKTEDLISF